MSGIGWTAPSRVLLITDCPSDATDLALLIETVGFDVTIAVPRGAAVPPGLSVGADFMVVDVRGRRSPGRDTPALLRSHPIDVPIAVISVASIPTAIHTLTRIPHRDQGTSLSIHLTRAAAIAALARQRLAPPSIPLLNTAAADCPPRVTIDHRIVRGWHFIVEDISAEPSCAKCAGMLGLGPSRFRQLFTQSLGISLGRFMTETRLQVAGALLAGTDRRISDIAWSVGFHEPSGFGRSFRRYFATTPKGYRTQSHVARATARRIGTRAE
jgi:AraC-like DNA-binding protein